MLAVVQCLNKQLLEVIDCSIAFTSGQYQLSHFQFFCLSSQALLLLDLFFPLEVLRHLYPLSSVSLIIFMALMATYIIIFKYYHHL